MKRESRVTNNLYQASIPSQVMPQCTSFFNKLLKQKILALDKTYKDMEKHVRKLGFQEVFYNNFSFYRLSP